jgi:hypothetical protein
MHSDQPAGSIAPTLVRCTQADVPLRVLTSWLPPQPWVLPIVDEVDRFIGFASSTHPSRLPLPPRLIAGLPVREFAFGDTLVLSEAFRWADALRFMAHKHTRFVALLDDGGTPEGLLRDLDGLRALAAHPL